MMKVAMVKMAAAAVCALLILSTGAVVIVKQTARADIQPAAIAPVMPSAATASAPPTTGATTQSAAGSVMVVVENHGGQVRVTADGKILDAGKLRVSGQPVIITANAMGAIDSGKSALAGIVADKEGFVESVAGKLRMTSRFAPGGKVAVFEMDGPLQFETGVPLDLRMLPSGDAALVLSPPLSAKDKEILDAFMRLRRSDLIGAYGGSEDQANAALKAQGSSLEMELDKMRAALAKELSERWMWERRAGTPVSFSGKVYRTKTGAMYLRTNWKYPKDVALGDDLPDLKPGQMASVRGILRVREHMVTKEEEKALTDSKEEETPWPKTASAGLKYRELYFDKPVWKAYPALPAAEGATAIEEKDGLLMMNSGGTLASGAKFTLNVPEGTAVRGIDKAGAKVGELVVGANRLELRAVGGKVQVTSGEQVLEADRVEVYTKQPK